MEKELKASEEGRKRLEGERQNLAHRVRQSEEEDQRGNKKMKVGGEHGAGAEQCRANSSSSSSLPVLAKLRAN